MATVEFSRAVPADLSERFLLQEAPAFEVVRAEGDVCLWRSPERNDHRTAGDGAGMAPARAAPHRDSRLHHLVD